MRKLLRGDRDQQTGFRRASGETLGWTEVVRAVSDTWGEPWEELLHSRGSGIGSEEYSRAYSPFYRAESVGMD